MLILADDLSGAADCAVNAVGVGLRAVVMLEAGLNQTDEDVVAIDLDSRARPAFDAARLHKELIGQGLSLGPKCLIYKKFDSTLRGHVGAEIAACLAAAPVFRSAIVAPAFPAMSRIVRSGRVLVGGVPLEDTELGSESGIKQCTTLQSMLESSNLKTSLVGLDEIRASSQALIRSLESRIAQGVKAIVCDAENDQDLGRLAVASCALQPLPLMAGSAGFACQLARRLGQRRVFPEQSPQCHRIDRPILVAVGSRSSVSREQLRCLTAAEPGILELRVAAWTLLAEQATQVRRELSRQLREAAREGQDVLISLGADPYPATGAELAQAFASLVGEGVSEFGALVATGGETARAMLGHSKVERLQLVRELETGVAMCVTQQPAPLVVVTKAGAFGGVDTLLRVWRELRGLRRNMVDPIIWPLPWS